MKKILKFIAIFMLIAVLLNTAYEIHYLFSFTKGIEFNYNVNLKINE